MQRHLLTWENPSLKTEFMSQLKGQKTPLLHAWKHKSSGNSDHLNSSRWLEGRFGLLTPPSEKSLFYPPEIPGATRALCARATPPTSSAAGRILSVRIHLFLTLICVLRKCSGASPPLTQFPDRTAPVVPSKSFRYGIRWGDVQASSQVLCLCAWLSQPF